MLNTNLPGLIKEAMLSKNEARLRTLRQIKAEFTEYQKSAIRRDLTEAAEFSILRKMIAARKESHKIYLEAGREDLAKSELQEIEVLTEFLGSEPGEEEIKEFAKSKIGSDREMRNLKTYIGEVKNKFPSADGKTICDICKSIILGK